MIEITLRVGADPEEMKRVGTQLIEMAKGLEQPMLPGITTTIETTIPTATPVPETIPDVIPAPIVDTVPEVDNRGMIWDKRIHSASPTIKATGEWRNKRSVDATLLATVEAELLGQPIAAAPAPEAPTPAPTPPQAATEPIVTFGDLMGAIVRNNITPPQVQEAVLAAGVQSVALLAARPDLIPAVAANLGL